MKIVTWNLARLDKKKNEAILRILTELEADILILTETNSIINPGIGYNYSSTAVLPARHDKIAYKQGENRVTIWTKYPVIKTFNTFDDFTSVCADINTPYGDLRIYGTIIGVFGGKGTRFKDDLTGQLEDYAKLFRGKNICLSGDMNISFSGYAYPSHKARQTLNDICKEFSLINLTASIDDNVDHIIISNDFVMDRTIKIETWNLDKKLSDHIGICISI